MIAGEDRVLALLAEANPVGDVDSFTNDPATVALVERAERLTPERSSTRGRFVRERSRSRRRRWFAAVAAATAVVVVIGAGGWLNLTGRGAPDASDGGVPTSVFDGTTCHYTGPSDFPVGSEVAFTFINESDVPDMFYVVMKVPDGTTAQQIYETSLRVPGTNQARDTMAYSDFPALTDEVQLTATLDREGLYALTCIETDPDEGNDHANLVTATTD